MRIVFLRHGDKDRESPERGLTQKGMEEAEQTAEFLKDKDFDEIYCSNMLRAKQTAEKISNKKGIDIKIDESLNEFETGVLRRHKFFWNKESKYKHKSLHKFTKKLKQERESEKKILVVAHGITNRILIPFFIRISRKTLKQFKQHTCGMNSIKWSREMQDWKLDYWNRIAKTE